jgi:hypothetical protein
VNDTVHIGAEAINQQVHADFARHATASGDLLAVEVNDDHVGRLHGAFADAGGCDEDAVSGKAHGEIAVHGGDVAVLVEHATVTNDFFPMFALRSHGYPWGENDKKQAAVGHSHTTSRQGAETIQNIEKN